MKVDRFYKDVLNKLLLVSLTFALCRITYGIWGWVLVLLGMVFALRSNYGGLVFCYIMFPMIAVFNPVLCGLSLPLALAARFGILILGASLILGGAMGRINGETVPLRWLFVYMFVAAISSIDGWFPLISFLKLTQFFFFILGIVLVSRIIYLSDKGVYNLRSLMMALAIIMIIGSLIVKFVPDIGYSMMVRKMEQFGIDFHVQDYLRSENMTLFNGMTSHSQMLAPVVSILATWVLCDMLLVEKRVTLLHSILLGLSPVLLYLSRSRGGFLTFVAIMGLTAFVCLPKARLSRSVRNHLLNIFLVVIVLIIVVGSYLEIKNDTFSKWLRKTDDVRGDNRTLTEAMTSSRMGLVEENLKDFYLNPILGKGFQVMPWLKDAYGNGFITWYSAPIEKGVTPAVVLGETGLIGSTVFIIFLCSFYATCVRRRYLAVMNMFTCTLISNLADSTLFSPSGLGGFLWISSCIGGFGIDLIAKRSAGNEIFMPQKSTDYDFLQGRQLYG